MTEHSGGYQEHPMQSTGTHRQNYFNSLIDFPDNLTLIFGPQPYTEFKSLYNATKWNLEDFIANEVDWKYPTTLASSRLGTSLLLYLPTYFKISLLFSSNFYFYLSVKTNIFYSINNLNPKCSISYVGTTTDLDN